MIDTHAHLTDERLASQIDAVLARAKKAGVTKIIVPSTTLKDARVVVEIAGKYNEVFGLVGVHPENIFDLNHSSKPGSQGHPRESGDLYRFPIELASLKLRRSGSGMTIINGLTKLVQTSKKVVGIGEIGLDFHYDREKRGKTLQLEIFKGQLDLAVKLKLPVAVHMRDAEEEMRGVLKTSSSLPAGQFHCWSGSDELLGLVLEKGFYVSFCGNITYKSAGLLREQVKRVPFDRLLLETDSPYMRPSGSFASQAGGRGSLNEPANVKIIAEYSADLLGVSSETLINQTTANAQCLYLLG